MFLPLFPSLFPPYKLSVYVLGIANLVNVRLGLRGRKENVELKVLFRNEASREMFGWDNGELRACKSYGSVKVGFPTRRQDPGRPRGSQYSQSPGGLLPRGAVLRGDGVPGARRPLSIPEDAYHCRGRPFHADRCQNP